MTDLVNQHFDNYVYAYSGSCSKFVDVLYKTLVYRSIAGESSLHQTYPFACFLVLFVSSHVPEFFLSFTLGGSLVNSFVNFYSFVFIVLTWFLTFYSPNDFFRRMLNNTHVMAILLVFNEVNRMTSYTSVLGKVLSYSSASLFQKMFVPTIYCLSFMMIIFPLTQLMDAHLVVHHEAKHLSLGSLIVFMYTFVFTAGLYLDSTRAYFMPFAGGYSLGAKALLSVAVVLQLAKLYLHWDPLSTCLLEKFHFSCSTVHGHAHKEGEVKERLRTPRRKSTEVTALATEQLQEELVVESPRRRAGRKKVL